MNDEIRCGTCKYLGAKNEDRVRLSDGEIQELHFCENKDSIFRSCSPVATGCNQYEKVGE